MSYATAFFLIKEKKNHAQYCYLVTNCHVLLVNIFFFSRGLVNSFIVSKFLVKAPF